MSRFSALAVPRIESEIGGGQRQLPFSRLDLLEKPIAHGHPLSIDYLG
jgi:hypothetical protein